VNILTLALEIAVIAIAYVMLSVVVQRKASNYARIKQIKVEMNAKMAELKAMGKDATKELMAQKQKEITSLASESMRHQLKATFIILPIFFILFYVALPRMFPGTQPTINVMSFKLTYQTFFIAIAFIGGLLSSMLLAVYEKARSKQQAKSAPQPIQ
jgi:uncharacterized membrane protein (DUF106 family)